MILIFVSSNLRSIFDIPARTSRIKELDHLLSKHQDWQQIEKIKPLLQEKSQLEETVQLWQRYKSALEDLNVLYELAMEENDSEVLKEVKKKITQLEKQFKKLELQWLLNEPADKLNAIMEIHAGAGGTDAQDWAEMLLRMYVRWAEKTGFKVDFLDTLRGEEAGIKSVTFLVKGPYAYGFLKGEIGVHRLIRLSPFDTGRRRHTSFAAVSVYPQVNEEIKIELKESDLKIETFRSSGAGGQHVNKVETGVRITHLPTGIVVQSQSERSQFRNKEAALMLLKSRLYDLEQRKQDEKKREMYANQKEIAWGSQIRTYTLHPYKLVKDHRTQLGIPQVEAVLDGEIDSLIETYLLSHKKKFSS
ncbi:MAG: peptide chain release factor 2 [Candidatus Desulfofervidaceae bacterium]|nr:peptide chain release factor 2 [Candidatus Desulfofervidaceae bacterium]